MMNDEHRLKSFTEPGNMVNVLHRVRVIDPTCTEDAVQRYIQEIAEAERILERVPFEGDPVINPFSAWWTVEETH